MIPKDIFVYETESVKDALKKLDKASEKILFVIDSEKRLLGTITDGDIRRYILKGKSLENSLKEVYHNQPAYIMKGKFLLDEVKEKFKHSVKALPVLDDKKRVIDIITRDQIFSESEIAIALRGEIDVPVVIMAGGKGTRLEPFSKIFPKPLIPIGDTPIVEIIINEFKKYGVREFCLILNYKGEMIKSYFTHMEKDYDIKYIWEDDYRGTAGSLKLLEAEIGDVFIVSNCDVIVKANFEEVVNFHKEQNALLTVLSSIQHHKIPYGVVRFKDGGEVIDIIEKPEYSLTINAGVYVLSKDVLKFIPPKSRLDMTDLIKSLIENNKKVIIYPINENDYIDIGQWEEYKKAIEKL